MPCSYCLFSARERRIWCRRTAPTCNKCSPKQPKRRDLETLDSSRHGLFPLHRGRARVSPQPDNEMHSPAKTINVQKEKELMGTRCSIANRLASTASPNDLSHNDNSSNVELQTFCNSEYIRCFSDAFSTWYRDFCVENRLTMHAYSAFRSNRRKPVRRDAYSNISG